MRPWRFFDCALSLLVEHDLFSKTGIHFFGIML